MFYMHSKILSSGSSSTAPQWFRSKGYECLWGQRWESNGEIYVVQSGYAVELDPAEPFKYRTVYIPGMLVGASDAFSIFRGSAIYLSRDFRYMKVGAQKINRVLADGEQSLLLARKMLVRIYELNLLCRIFLDNTLGPLERIAVLATFYTNNFHESGPFRSTMQIEIGQIMGCAPATICRALKKLPGPLVQLLQRGKLPAAGISAQEVTCLPDEPYELVEAMRGIQCVKNEAYSLARPHPISARTASGTIFEMGEKVVTVTKVVQGFVLLGDSPDVHAPGQVDEILRPGEWVGIESLFGIPCQQFGLWATEKNRSISSESISAAGFYDRVMNDSTFRRDFLHSLSRRIGRLEARLSFAQIKHFLRYGGTNERARQFIERFYGYETLADIPMGLNKHFASLLGIHHETFSRMRTGSGPYAVKS